MKKNLLIINSFFVLYFFNKYLLNRYQITIEEIRSLILFSLIIIFLLNFLNIAIYFLFGKKLKLIYLNSLLFAFFLNYGKITYFLYFNNFEFMMMIPNYSFITFILFVLISCLLFLKINTEKIVMPSLIFYIILIFLINFPISPRNASTDNLQSSYYSDLQLDSKPDIYFILLDGYPNLNVAKQYYSYDTEKVYKLFNENNIDIFEDSTAPYNKTIYTLSSIFEMQYLFQPPEMSFKLREEVLIDFLNSSSAIERILKNNGYQLAKYGIKAFCSDEDLCLNKYFENVNTKNTVFFDLLMETPFKVFVEKEWIDTKNLSILGCSDNCLDSSVDASIDEILNLINQKKTKPIFAFIHLMNSHDPYILDENCELLESPSYKLAKDDVNQFNRNLDCSYSEMKKLVNLINLENSVLIFQSDHGPQFDVMKNVVGRNIESLSDDQLINRYTTFSASNINLFCSKKQKYFQE